MNARIVAIFVGIIVIALLAWYVIAHQNFTSTLPNYTATTTASVTPAPTVDVSNVAASVAGTWQSNDDPNYSIVVTSDGKWTDNYKGSTASSSISQTGTYELFTSANPDPDFTGTIVPGVVYVKVVEGSSTLYFSVL
ncbi:MAG TPA: hypothetical protein VG102_02590 [Candidatus Paceibacterota bacterium]|nr:hypothetical protein [Candidatus Paceibacterota bacterium]